jgi:hypothetical protein
MVVSASVQSDDLAALMRSLRRAENGRELRKQLRRDLRGAAKPAIPAIRSKVKSLPSRGESKRRGRPPLRRSVARATRLQMTARNNFVGVTVRVDPKKMPPGMHNLPAYLEGRDPFHRWRHPVFGDTDTWVQQRSRPYFYDTMRRFTPDAERAIAQAAESIQRQINE